MGIERRGERLLVVCNVCGSTGPNILSEGGRGFWRAAEMGLEKGWEITGDYQDPTSQCRCPACVAQGREIG